MTKRMLASRDSGGAVAALVAGNENLQKDLEASKKGARAFREYVDENYKSDGDYWLVHKDGSVSWDGHLNFYKEGETDKNDATAGFILGYKDLDKKIADAEKTGKTKLTLGDTEVDVSRLKQIQGYNKKIVESGTGLFGIPNSDAAKALLSDGFMSYKEAEKAKNQMFMRTGAAFTSNAINKMLGWNSNDLPSFLNEISPDMIEHYSVRYILNDNEEFKKELSKNKTKDDWANFERGSNSLIDNWKNTPITLLPPILSAYHGDKNALKYTLKNGRELVIQPDYAVNEKEKNIINWHFDTNESTYGTYNYSTFGPLHFAYDMWPYYKWGNTPDDMYATDINKRIHPKYYDFLREHEILKALSNYKLKEYLK